MSCKNFGSTQALALPKFWLARVENIYLDRCQFELRRNRRISLNARIWDVVQMSCTTSSSLLKLLPSCFSPTHLLLFLQCPAKLPATIIFLELNRTTLM
uniref:Uncharacterized protein n=1 Tax=Oryza brachyantha TaxID=4533 RepID=J3M2W2_ORYBR